MIEDDSMFKEIKLKLEESGFSDLKTHILLLLYYFRGIEPLMERFADYPCNQVLDILNTSKDWPESNVRHFIINKISRLSAFFYQTNGDYQKWNPLHGSYQEFRIRNKRKETWIDNEQYPAAEYVEKWLKGAP